MLNLRFPRTLQTPDARVWQSTTAVCLLIAAAFSLYWPAITSSLVSDDWDLSIPGTRPWSSWFGHWFGGGEGPFYRPLTRLLIFYEARLFGYSGLGQHVVSMLLFLGTVGLTSQMVSRVGGRTAAFVTALLLVTSPVAANVTSWVASQTDLLVGLFMALSIYPLAVPPDKVSRKAVWGSLVFGFCAYLAKESAAILGPVGAAYSLYVALLYGWSGRRLVKLAVLAGLLHAVLMGLYLLFRLWRLGHMGTGGTFVPDGGKIWHASELYISAVRDFFLPLSQTFPVVPSSSLTTLSAVWPLLLTAFVIFALLAYRRYVLSFLITAFVISLIPLLTGNAPYYYPEFGMTDVRRYLYVPSFFLFSALGMCCRRRGTGEVLVWVLILAMFNGMVAQKRINDYAMAGKYVSTLAAKVKEAAVLDTAPVFYVSQLPDMIGEAYVFRNGFESMMKSLFPDSKTFHASSTSINQLPAGNVYIVSGLTADNISIKKLEPQEVRKRQVSRRAVKPFILNFANDPEASKKVTLSETVQVDSYEGPLLVRVTGPDPIVFIPLSSAAPPSDYKQVYITLEFLDAPTDPAEEIMQYLWLLSSAGQEVSFVNANITIKPGIQTISFNVAAHPQWYDDGTFIWHRIDLPESYRGRVSLHAIGLR